MPKSSRAEKVESSSIEPLQSPSTTQNESVLRSASDTSEISFRPDSNTIGPKGATNEDSAVKTGPDPGEGPSRPSQIKKGISSSKRETSPKIVISSAESEAGETSSSPGSETGEDRETEPESSVAANPTHVKQESRDNEAAPDGEQVDSSDTEPPNGESEGHTAHARAVETPQPKAEKNRKSALEVFNGFFVGCDAHERFHDNDTQCLANTEKGVRCRAKIRGSDKVQIQKCLDILQGLFETERYIAELQKLAKIAVCKHSDPSKSHRSKTLSRIAALVVSNGEIIDMHGLRPETTVIRQARAPTQARRVGDTATVHSHWMTRTRRSPAVLARITAFVPYLPESLKRLSMVEIIRGQMERPLSAREAASGFLYVYWDESNFGYCKIGITTGAVNQRLERWQTQCRKPATQLYECESLQTPHVYRLEALVHAELKNYRRKELRCLACNKTHREWFCVPDPRTIPRTIAIWRDWMLKEPYELVEGQWSLKAMHASDVDMMCQRLLEPSPILPPSQSTVRSPLRPRSPRQVSGGRGRYNLRRGPRD